MQRQVNAMQNFIENTSRNLNEDEARTPEGNFLEKLIAFINSPVVTVVGLAGSAAPQAMSLAKMAGRMRVLRNLKCMSGKCTTTANLTGLFSIHKRECTFIDPKKTQSHLGFDLDNVPGNLQDCQVPELVAKYEEMINNQARAISNSRMKWSSFSSIASSSIVIVTTIFAFKEITRATNVVLESREKLRDTTSPDSITNLIAEAERSLVDAARVMEQALQQTNVHQRDRILGQVNAIIQPAHNRAVLALEKLSEIQMLINGKQMSLKAYRITLASNIASSAVGLVSQAIQISLSDWSLVSLGIKILTVTAVTLQAAALTGSIAVTYMNEQQISILDKLLRQAIDLRQEAYVTLNKVNEKWRALEEAFGSFSSPEMNSPFEAGGMGDRLGNAASFCSYSMSSAQPALRNENVELTGYDDDLPSTTVRVRFADGSALTLCANKAQTVGHVRHFLQDRLAKNQVILWHGVSRLLLKNDEATLTEESLLKGTIYEGRVVEVSI